ncbi:MAG: acyltransferase [Sediminibacterium sp.]|nr:acyltransferase [Sediminibacterium sp.]
MPEAPIKIEREANNFDLIRIIFAWFVIVSHSYVLNGVGESDPLGQLTSNYLILSFIGVKGFFVISGYLILQSLTRSKSVIDYLVKRILRIFPGLIVVLILTLVAVYFIYPTTQVPYLLNPAIYHYFWGNLVLFSPPFFIHGVFDHLPSRAINGSLWTIEFEFLFYIVLLLLFPIKKNIKALRWTLLGMMALFTVGNLFYPSELLSIKKPIPLDLVFDLGIYFITGSFFACINWEKWDSSKYLFIAAVLLFIAMIIFKIDRAWLFTCLPFVILYIGQMKSKAANWVHQKLGDPSYGIYLYAFPIQQLIVYYCKPSTFELFLYASIGAFAFGILSWKFIEKKALTLKRFIK